MQKGDLVILMSKTGTLRPPWYGKMGIIVSGPEDTINGVQAPRESTYDKSYAVMIDGKVLDISEQYLSKEFSIEEKKSEKR